VGSWLRLAALALTSTLITGASVACSGASASRPEATADPAPVAPREAATPDPTLLRFTYDDRPTVGAFVKVAATDLPAGKTADLVWASVTGGWVVEDYYRFRGKKYQPTRTSLGRFTIDAGGTLDAHFTIPEDYGGMHDVLAIVDGVTVAQNGLEVTQTFEMTPASGPIGTPIEIKVTGLGYGAYDSTWVVNWDNSMVGFVSAASTRGSAVARFRAAGPSGEHSVQLLTGYQGQGYLNHEQAPNRYLPRPRFTFETTTERPASTVAYAEPYQRQPVPATEIEVAGATAALSPTQGPVGTRATLRGQGLPKGTSLHLVWQTSTGSRITGRDFELRERRIGTVVVGPDGRLEAPVTIPDDLGGLHGIELRNDEDTVARLFFVIETSIVSITPASGPVGTPVSIHLKGVGWTEYDNLYVATYDNAYMGYVCGFASQGDVVINFHATGRPGPHIIDLYPGIYQGPPTEPQLLYRQAQLTYADDHPGNKIPALRFVFDITAPKAR
jgi:hypothetical protein